MLSSRKMLQCKKIIEVKIIIKMFYLNHNIKVFKNVVYPEEVPNLYFVVIRL